MVKQWATTLMIGTMLMGMVVQATADVVPNLGRGVNLGNKLDSPKGQPWGPRLEAWNFAKAKAGGFDTVRLPVRWHEYAANTAPYTIDAKFMDSVAKALDQALANNLNVVVNIHHYDPLFEDPQAENAKFQAMWQQIAERFKDLPNERVVFEILNEPHGKLTTELWNEVFLQAYNVVRQSNPNRYIMVGPAEWGGVDAMYKLKLPADNKLIFTVHYYEPMQFTHQGAEWWKDSEQWCGMRWTATEEQQSLIRKRLDEVVTWAKAHNNIPVFLGEFGTYKKCALPEDQVRWANFVARESERRGFSWAYWEFNSGFGCHGATERDGWNYLHRALIPEVEEIQEVQEAKEAPKGGKKDKKSDRPSQPKKIDNAKI